MSTTKVRKMLQDKLRKKFGWKTWSQNNRFTSLIKPEAMRYSHPKRKDKYTISLTIDIFDYRIKERLLCEPAYMGDLTITLTENKQLDDGSTEAEERLETYLTIEELEMIYKIAKEKEMEVFNNLDKIKRNRVKGEDMSRQYDLYLEEHKGNVKKGFDWIKENLPELIIPMNGVDYEHQIGFAHDASKTDPDEYEAYDAYFYGGNRSYQVVQDFNYAWLRHIHHNPHHWQAWILV